jgi:hypothetical protein
VITNAFPPSGASANPDGSLDCRDTCTLRGNGRCKWERAVQVGVRRLMSSWGTAPLWCDAVATNLTLHRIQHLLQPLHVGAGASERQPAYRTVHKTHRKPKRAPPCHEGVLSMRSLGSLGTRRPHGTQEAP